MISGYNHNFWEQPTAEVSSSMLDEYNSSFINGFQMATLAGPLCEEPMMGVAFIIKDWTIESTAR